MYIGIFKFVFMLLINYIAKKIENYNKTLYSFEVKIDLPLYNDGTKDGSKY